MKLTKISVPFGVIGIIYEARPNVSFDVFSLCLKSGNACILKGGSDADCSNRAIISVIHEVLGSFNINPHIVELLPADREATAALLNAVGYVDLIIPRGSSNLINFVRNNAKIPVIETGAGICHTYFDEFGEVKKGADIIHNAKTRRVSVCNALDCVIVHEKRLVDLPKLCEKLKDSHLVSLKVYDTSNVPSRRAKGEIHINKCATEVLSSEKAVSILPIGITHIEGEFEKDDIVRIIDFQGNQVGVGKANCDSQQAKEVIGKHGKKPVVHYDYLYIE